MNVKSLLVSTMMLLPWLPCSAQSQSPRNLEQLAQVFQKTFEKEIQDQYGLQMRIQLDREQPLYFGGSSVENGVFSISTGAKILSLKAMNLDAAAFVLCHEVGHLMGGEPKKESNPWSSVEGQCDYFAATKCLPRILPQIPQIAKIAEPLKICSDHFADKSASFLSLSLCSRILSAGQSLMDAIYLFMDVPQMKKPDLSTPAEPLISGEKINYPSLQCRLDTVLAGATHQPHPTCW